MNFVKRKNHEGDRITFYYDFGGKAGQRPSTGIFIFTKPKDQTERNHNKEALSLLKVKESQVRGELKYPIYYSAAVLMTCFPKGFSKKQAVSTAVGLLIK